MTGLTPWLVLLGLGAFYGLNPATGWLAVLGQAGLAAQEPGKVLWSLLPISLGHAISIAGVVAVVTSVRRMADFDALRGDIASVSFFPN